MTPSVWFDPFSILLNTFQKCHRRLLEEVEQLLLRHPAVRDVAVVVGEHPVKGTVPVAFVVLSEPGAGRAHRADDQPGR